MSTDGPNGISDKILVEVLAMGKTVGRIEEHCAAMDRRLDGIDRRLEQGSSHMHELGTASAMQSSQLSRHERSISSLYKRVDATEDTGVHHLIEERTRWGTLRWIAVILVGVLGAFATVSNLVKCSGAPTRAHDAAAQAARR
jgi:chromosome segregation ATPase